MLDFLYDQRHSNHYIDLRSDTVTQPTPTMYARMQVARIGDDGLDGDPSARELEDRVAALLCKESGLFVPTCTMANLLAALSHTERFQQVVLEASSHMFTTERAGANLSSICYVPVSGVNGAMNIEDLERTARSGGYQMETGLIAIETSHNNAGGTVLSIEHLKAVHDLAARLDIPVHIDGARFMNASVALDEAPSTLAKFADTVSVCLSKGLSAPVGAVLTGSLKTIARARKLRKVLGGTQRQVGVVAAAGLEAIENMIPRLAEDHRSALNLAEKIRSSSKHFSVDNPQTNIVQVDVGRTGRSSQYWVQELADRNVLTRAFGDRMLRLVTHRHICYEDIIASADTFKSIVKSLEHAGDVKSGPGKLDGRIGGIDELTSN